MLTMTRCSRHCLVIKVSRGARCQPIITALASSLSTGQVTLHMAPRHCKRFRVPKQPLRSVAKNHDVDLTPPEEIRARRIRRFIFLGILSVCALGTALYFAAPAIGGAIKAWQSRRTARQVFALIDQKKWTEADGKARDA